MTIAAGSYLDANTYFGLFGYLSSSAEVKNLGMADMSIAALAGGKPVGNGVGGIAGHNRGTISACYSTGSINGGDVYVGGLVGDNNGGTISACYSTGSVSGGNLHVGGLVGDNFAGTISASHSTASVGGGERSSDVGGLVGYAKFGAISACYSTGSVSGHENVGGLVGENDYGGISACYSTGPVSGSHNVGGLVGASVWSTISACYSTGSVSGRNSTGPLVIQVEVGGLVGYHESGTITACYSVGPVSPDPNGPGGGGLVGRKLDGTTSACFWDIETSCQGTSAGGTGLLTAQMYTAKTFLDAGWDFLGERANGLCDYWQVPAGAGYPVLSIFNGYVPRVLQGTGTLSDPYLLKIADDLSTIWCRPMAHYQLVADIDLSGTTWGIAVIPAFCGSLDGKWHRIAGMTISGGGCTGLIGMLFPAAVVMNLGLEDVNNVSSTGDDAGALVGDNIGGKISNCYSTGSVRGIHSVGGLVGHASYGTISGCYSTGSVSGSGPVGGLVGYASCGTISGCYSTGSVSGSGLVGGLVGYNYAGTISGCYSTGSVSGGYNVGGLVGSDDGGTISACFWDIKTSRQTGSAGGTGLTTTQMQTAQAFLDAGWDFVGETANGTEDLWWIDEGKDYPRLWWEGRN